MTKVKAKRRASRCGSPFLVPKIYLQKPVNNTTTVTVELFNNHENLRGNIYE
jgi:hypothetical protein